MLIPKSRYQELIKYETIDKKSVLENKKLDQVIKNENIQQPSEKK